jgi:hypothetical protein
MTADVVNILVGDYERWRRIVSDRIVDRTKRQIYQRPDRAHLVGEDKRALEHIDHVLHELRAELASLNSRPRLF